MAALMLLLLLCALNAWQSFGADENAYQQNIGCAFNRQGQAGHFWHHGYNSKDVMHIDLVKETMVPSGEVGRFLVEERKSVEYVKKKENRLRKLCSAVQTVFFLSNSSLSRAVKPTAHVKMGGEKGQEFLMCLVHGFYPNVIRVQWNRYGKPIYYGTSTTGILPHKDGTFQMSIFLSLTNTTVHGVTCEIEHISIDGKMLANMEEKSMHLLLSVITAVMAFFAGIAFPVGTTTMIIHLKMKQTPRSPESTTKSSEVSETPPSMSLMHLSAEL